MQSGPSKKTMKILQRLQDMWAKSDNAQAMGPWQEGDKYLIAIPVKGDDYPMPDYSVISFSSFKEAAMALYELGFNTIRRIVEGEQFIPAEDIPLPPTEH